ncbi:DEAD/DEAH box helicase [Marisediminicola antarctica]|uniref:RNA helicase n=1 Tax=Marisediminicola antarctica TaxID=674079 RepID=A0A7L5AFP9_9MICO|nr:DEAD/DEAH box helicase [Marisediminicola antarctica]QHO68802.1 RNA helicase [Marisediminicola antarctica]
MPDYKKPNNNKFESRKPASSSAPGSRSEGHRGFHGDAAPAKKRWTNNDRAARSGDRPASNDRRPDWNPRERPAYNDRPNRGGSGDRPQRNDRPNTNDRAPRSNDRPSYGDRPQRNDRPSYGDRPQRNDRPSYGDRAQRTERPSYGDRPQRTERPSYGERTERPSYNDRPARTERPSYGDRPQRTERPSHGDRPATNDRAPRTNFNDRDRPQRTERPSYGDRPERSSYGDRSARTERPSYGDRPERTERPSYGDRPERSSYSDRSARTERPSYNDRPARTERPSYNDRPSQDDRPKRAWEDRAPRNNFDERPQRRTSDLYPSRDAKSGPHEDVVLERLEAKVITAGDVEGKTFGDLGLGDNITRQLATMGAAAPFPIQAATIPDVLAGKDVLGRGKTGSGKTIAFGAPLVERLMENNGGKGRKPGRKPRALILAPTRELAMQINRTVEPIARSVGLFTTTIVGGVPQFKQVSTLQRGVDIVIATPGRVEDLIEQGRLDLSEVIVTVLDEADHMCDLGFLEPVQRILTSTAKGGQKLLFSATLDKGVATLVKQFLKDPAVHEVAGEDQASSTIDHKVLLIEQRDKRAIIEQLASGAGKTLIFARTRAFAEELADQLEDAGVPATSLHGDLNQSRRTRNLQLLTSGRVNVLVATDVAARGIHVDDITLVIQADAPDEYKSYLHRAGRTGRAGKVGTVVTLVSKSRKRRMDELLGRAEIRATSVAARPGDALLDELAAL